MIERQIIFYKHYFQEFYIDANDKIKEKIGYVFRLIKTVDKVPEKILKHLKEQMGFMKLELR